MVSFPVDHIALAGGPTEVLVDWGHRTTPILSPANLCHSVPSRHVFLDFKSLSIDECSHMRAQSLCLM